METGREPIIGIVGGMGPEAGIDLLNNILRFTNASKDQEHLSTMLMSFPSNIADRTLFIEGKISINPAFSIIKIIDRLIVAGANIIGIACNTSHSPEIYNVILKELNKKNSNIKLLNMPYETCRLIKENHSNFRRVGLMATNGTYKSGIYEKHFNDWGYEIIIPDFTFQNEIIHEMIYNPEFGIKSNPKRIRNEAKLLLDKAINYFIDKETDAIILGCTELSLIVDKQKYKDISIIDSTESLAKSLIREVKLFNKPHVQIEKN